MKKILSYVLLAAMIFISLPANASGGVTVLLDGRQLAFDVQPQIMNGRTMVPLRAIFEAMGAIVGWNDETQTVTGTKGDTVVILVIGDTSPSINGKVVTIDQPGVIVDGRTLAPLRFVAEAFGGDVSWDGDTLTASIALGGARPITPDTSLLSETPPHVLEAYYEALKTSVDEYGYGDGYNGVVFADFIDLDDDGIPEMICIIGNDVDELKSEIYVNIYGYTEQLVLYKSYRLYPTHINEVRKATSRDGSSYLTYSEVGGLSGFDEYYRVVNGEWALALSLSWNEKEEIIDNPDITYEIAAQIDYWNDLYVNGNPVSLDLFINAPETELGIINERTLWNWWGYMRINYFYIGSADWRIDIAEYWDTVPTILLLLESLLTAS